MGVNFTDNEQNSIVLMNVGYYESKAEYMAGKYADVTEETAAEDFEHSIDLGYIREITCGTYNGATKVFTPWQISDNNILDTILNAIHEVDFYNYVARYHEDHPDELAELERWSNADYIREYTEVYEVFTIGGSVYVNKD